jgi:hypothetical protein
MIVTHQKKTPPHQKSALTAPKNAQKIILRSDAKFLYFKKRNLLSKKMS